MALLDVKLKLVATRQAYDELLKGLELCSKRAGESEAKIHGLALPLERGFSDSGKRLIDPEYVIEWSCETQFLRPGGTRTLSS